MVRYCDYMRACANQKHSSGLLGRFRAVQSLLRAEKGATALEWAMVSPVLILLVMIFVELTMMMFVNILVEGGLREAARYGITGQFPGEGTTTEREDLIKQIVLDNALGLIKDESTNVTFKVYGTFTQVGQGEPFVDANSNGKFDAGEDYTDQNGNGAYDADLGVPGLGGSGEIVSYEVEYDWELMTPFLAPFTPNGDGKFKFTASIVVRNEPF